MSHHEQSSRAWLPVVIVAALGFGASGLQTSQTVEFIALLLTLHPTFCLADFTGKLTETRKYYENTRNFGRKVGPVIELFSSGLFRVRCSRIVILARLSLDQRLIL